MKIIVVLVSIDVENVKIVVCSEDDVCDLALFLQYLDNVKQPVDTPRAACAEKEIDPRIANFL